MKTKPTVILACLLLVPAALRGDGNLVLIPNDPGPYSGGENLTVDVWLQNTDPVGHYLRLVRLDLSEARAQMYAGGWFDTAGNASAVGVAQWNDVDQVWAPMGSGLESPYSGSTWPAAWALAHFDDGNGPRVYIGGSFEGVGALSSNNFAVWDGSDFSTIGMGFSSLVETFAIHDDGTGGGPELYVGGLFSYADNGPVEHIAKWNGTTWEALDGGMDDGVITMTSYDDGNGAQLYVGGVFWEAGGTPAKYIARWDGTAWHAFGSGANLPVRAMAVYDGELYVAGSFSEIDGVAANYIARWDGASWATVGTGTNGWIYTLEAWDDGTGEALYVGGKFTQAGGVAAPHVAKWDGSSWSAVGDGFSDTVNTLKGSQEPHMLVAAGRALTLCMSVSLSECGCTTPPTGSNRTASLNGLLA